MRTLRTIAAVFRAAAGLDAEQARGLDLVGIEMSAVDALRAEHQVREGKIVKRLRFGPPPVVPDGPDALFSTLAVIPRFNQPVGHGQNLHFYR
jgi:hypothetical protein